MKNKNGFTLPVLLAVGFSVLFIKLIHAQAAHVQPAGPLATSYFDIAVDDVHQRIYGADWSGNKIDIIDMNTLLVTDTIPIGSQPAGMDINLDDSELAVALYGQAQIAFVDLNSLSVIARITPGGTSGPNQPFDVLYGRPGRLYSVGNPGSGGFDYVHVYDTVSKTEVGRSSEIMRAAPRLAMTADHNTLYVSQVTFSPQKIYRFDIRTDTPVQTAQAPHGPVLVNTLAVNADGSKVFSSRGQVWNGALNTQLGSFSPNGQEIEYVVSLDRFYISNASRISEFDTHYYLPLKHYPLSGTAGAARANRAESVLYVSTSTGIQAIHISAGNPVERISIAGPTTGEAGRIQTYVASVTPITATVPIYYMWQATGQTNVTHYSSNFSDAVSFTWNTPGVKHLTLTTLNPRGTVTQFYTTTITLVAPDRVTINGPITGETGVPHEFTAMVEPLTATTPLAYTWHVTGFPDVVHHTDQISDTVAFTWGVTGVKTIRVTVTNIGGSVFSVHPINITATPIETVTITGTVAGVMQTTDPFTATVLPVTATTPITYTWQATEQMAVHMIGGLQDTVHYTWQTPGVKTVSVSATNANGAIVTGTHIITIAGTPVPWHVPYFDIAVDDARQRIYASYQGGNALHVIDMHTLAVIAILPLGSQPVGLDMDPNGKELAVALFGQAQIAFVDLDSLSVTGRITPGGVSGSNRPYDVIYGRSGRLYSVGYPSASLDYIHVFDTVNKREVGRSTTSLASAARLAITTDHNTLYVGQTFVSPQEIYRFDIRTDTPARTASGPWGPVYVNTLAVSADGNKVFSSRGQVWNGALNTQLGTFAPSGQEIEYVHRLERFYISNGSQVSEFDAHYYLAMRHYPLSGTAGVARANRDGSVLYVSTSNGIEAIQLSSADPIASVRISGPIVGETGRSYAFTAMIEPLTLTTPVEFTWQATDLPVVVHLNPISDTITYTWGVTGPKTILVTASNAGGSVISVHQIHLTATPVETVTIGGPDTGQMQTAYTITAAALPLTATTPITYAWQASEQYPIRHTGGRNDSVQVTWQTPGVKTISISATNANGAVVTDTHTLTITGTPLPLPVTYFDIVVDNARQRIYGSDRNGNELHVIDMHTLGVITILPIGSQPAGLDMDPNGKELAVALYGQAQIAFVDLDSLVVTARLTPRGTSGPNQPYDVLYGRPGRLYSVGAPGINGLDYVHVYNTVNKTEVGRSTSIVRSAPRLAITSDHNTLYISESISSPDQIYRFNITTDTPVRTAFAPNGYAFVYTLAVSADGSKVFSSRGQVWDGALNTQLGTFSPSGLEIEYVSGLERFFISNGSQVSEFNAFDYSLVRSYPVSTAAGVARINGNRSILYVSTSVGIEAIHLPAVDLPESISIIGPGTGEMGTPHVFIARVEPLTVTTPLQYTWQATGLPEVVHTNQISDTVTFTWGVTGTQTITVTAANLGGSVFSVYHMDIIVTPIETVTISGPDYGKVRTAYRFTANALPLTANTPITYRWQATDQTPIVHTGGTNDTAQFTWQTPGVKTVFISATNASGTVVTDTHTITTTPAPYSVIYFDIAVDEARQRIYGSYRAGNALHVIDMHTLAVIAVLPIGSQPVGLDMDPNGNELAVALYGQAQIAFVDLNSLSVIARITPGGTTGPNQPFDVLYGRPGRLYSVGNPDSGGFDHVHVYDTVSKTEVGRSSEIMRAAPRLAMTTDHNTLFVSQVTFSPQKIYRFDIRTDTPVQTAQAPHGPVSVNTLAVSADGSKVFSSRGQVWNSALNTELGTFSPNGQEIEYVAGLERFYISNGSRVSEFDAANYSLIRNYPVSATTGVARVNAAHTILYVSTAVGIQAIPLIIPVQSVVISGPDTGMVGVDYTFVASVQPTNANLPITYIWEVDGQAPRSFPNEGIQDSITISFTEVSTRTIIQVTAINPYGSCMSTHAIQVTPLVTPIQGLVISGPDTATVGVDTTFLATVQPISATLPITYIWQVEGRAPMIFPDETISHNLTISFTEVSTQTIVQVTAINPGGSRVATHAIQVTPVIPPIVPFDSLVISGPETATVGVEYPFLATVQPISATLPITYVWQVEGRAPMIFPGESISHSLTISFTQVATQTAVQVTAINPAGSRVATHVVHVTPPIVSIEGLVISGPDTATVGVEYPFVATVQPISASLPITYIWQVEGREPMIFPNENISHSITISFTQVATRTTVQVTAINPGGSKVATHIISVTPLIVPIDGLVISGPNTATVGEDTMFLAAVQPISATLPITYIWQVEGRAPVIFPNENISHGLTISFTEVSTRTTILVTAINSAGSRIATHTIQVKREIVPIEGLVISGPDTAIVGEDIPFVATVKPISATLPITYIWQVEGRAPMIFPNENISHSLTISFTEVSTRTTIQVTATNPGGSITTTFSIKIIPKGYHLYLPILLKPTVTSSTRTQEKDGESFMRLEDLAPSQADCRLLVFQRSVRILFLHPRQLNRIVQEYIDFYNHSRPHQSIGQQIPERLAEDNSWPTRKPGERLHLCQF